MRIEDPMIVAALPELNVELRSPSALAGLTSLAIGGTTDLLRIKNHESIPNLLSLLDSHAGSHPFPGGRPHPLVSHRALPSLSRRKMVRGGRSWNHLQTQQKKFFRGLLSPKKRGVRASRGAKKAPAAS